MLFRFLLCPSLRTVRGTGYSFDERFGRDEPLSKSA
jgi:hypothetical protein